MKKNQFIKSWAILGFVAASFILPQLIKAEAMNTWRWDTHRIRFQLPKTFQVKYNKANAFIAKGDSDVTIKIGPTSASSNASDAKSAAMDGFQTYTVVLDRQIRGERQLTPKGGFERYIIFGNGKSSRTKSPIRFGVIGLFNPTTGKTLYARFWWFDKDNARFNALTFKIAESVSAF